MGNFLYYNITFFFFIYLILEFFFLFLKLYLIIMIFIRMNFFFIYDYYWGIIVNPCFFFFICHIQNTLNQLLISWINFNHKLLLSTRKRKKFITTHLSPCFLFCFLKVQQFVVLIGGRKWLGNHFSCFFQFHFVVFEFLTCWQTNILSILFYFFWYLIYPLCLFSIYCFFCLFFY